MIAQCRGPNGMHLSRIAGAEDKEVHRAMKKPKHKNIERSK